LNKAEPRADTAAKVYVECVGWFQAETAYDLSAVGIQEEQEAPPAVG
jgi:hypothetical protein